MSSGCLEEDPSLIVLALLAWTNRHEKLGLRKVRVQKTQILSDLPLSGPLCSYLDGTGGSKEGLERRDGEKELGEIPFRKEWSFQFPGDICYLELAYDSLLFHL